MIAFQVVGGIVDVECSFVKSCNCCHMVKLTFLIVCE